MFSTRFETISRNLPFFFVAGLKKNKKGNRVEKTLA